MYNTSEENSFYLRIYFTSLEVFGCSSFHSKQLWLTLIMWPWTSDLFLSCQNYINFHLLLLYSEPNILELEMISCSLLLTWCQTLSLPWFNQSLQQKTMDDTALYSLWKLSDHLNRHNGTLSNSHAEDPKWVLSLHHEIFSIAADKALSELLTILTENLVLMGWEQEV